MKMILSPFPNGIQFEIPFLFYFNKMKKKRLQGAASTCSYDAHPFSEKLISQKSSH